MSVYDDVDRYIAGLLVADDHEIDTEGLPAIEVTAPQGKLLMLLARIAGARRILEFGTLGGYSTLWLAKGLPADGELITLEADPGHAAVARRNLAGDPRIRLVEGPALETLPTLEGPFDLIFIDADKPGYVRYLDLSLELSRHGTVILADNLIRDGAVLDEHSAEENAGAARAFNARLAAHPRLESIIVPVLGKKVDGMSISFVR